MANTHIDKFFNRVAGSKVKAKDMTNVISDSGDFIELNGINAILLSLSNLLLIEEDTYLFEPELGIGVHLSLFEPNDNKTKSKLKRDIVENFKQYDGRAEIDVEINSTKNYDSLIVKINLKYRGDSREVSLDVNQDLLDRLRREV
ncbi:MAG: hypothetical protein ACOCQD_01620 [archaeon]